MANSRPIKRSSTNRNSPEEMDNYIMSDLFKHDYVLLIGSEAIFSKDYKATQGTGDSMFALYNSFADVFNIEQERRPTTDHGWQNLLSSSYTFNAGKSCRHILDGLWGGIKEDDKEIQRNDFRKKCKELPYESCGAYVEESLRSLLETKNFRIVFTTCIDDVLQSILEGVWGDKFKYYNFQCKDDIGEFIAMAKDHGSDLNEMSPCLVYLFGKAGDRRGPNYLPVVFSEDDALCAIAKYIKQDDSLSEVYSNFLQCHPLMSIGCHFDDWRFRFFWYALRNNDIANISGSGEGLNNRNKAVSTGTVAYPVSDPDPLEQFLTHCNVAVEPDSRKFMERLVGLLKNEDIIKNILRKRRKASKGIFISYASEEFSTAINVFEKLSEQGFNVWIDHVDLHEGDPYEDRIKKAILECDVFMPLLGHQTKLDLCSQNLSRYYMGEWSFAFSCGQKKFMPITFADYSARDGHYHKLFLEKCGLTGSKDIHIKTINELDKIIEDLNRILILEK